MFTLQELLVFERMLSTDSGNGLELIIRSNPLRSSLDSTPRPAFNGIQGKAQITADSGQWTASMSGIPGATKSEMVEPVVNIVYNDPSADRATHEVRGIEPRATAQHSIFA